MGRSTNTTSVGRKTLAALLMMVLLSVLIPTRGAEVVRSNELRACQDNVGTVAVMGHPFTLEVSKTAIYLSRPEKEICLPSPSILIYPRRGPPILS